MLRVLKNFTIKRENWLSYEAQRKEEVASYLREPDTRRMCCLGVYLRSCGVPTDALERVDYPENLLSESHLNLAEKAGLVEWPGSNTKVTSQLAKANDSKRLTRFEREARIKKLFKTLGVAIKFTGRLFPSKRARA